MRNSARLILAATVAMVLGIAPWANAATAEGTYTIGTTPFVGVVCSPDCLGEPDLNYGGYTFAKNGLLPLSVAIADQSGAVVSYLVGQDIDGDGFVGNTDPDIGVLEPSVNGCGNTADLALSGVAFRANLDTSVFVTLVDPLTCPDGLGLGGTITVTYADAV